MRLDFKKEPTGEWYIVLPDYHGPKEDLQMVYGADTMLDILSRDTNNLSIRVLDYYDMPTDESFELAKLTIPESLDQLGGQWYLWPNLDDFYAVWLCDVTLFVFGDFPDTIYFEVL